jgi:hypothetical protein
MHVTSIMLRAIRKIDHDAVMIVMAMSRTCLHTLNPRQQNCHGYRDCKKAGKDAHGMFLSDALQHTQYRAPPVSSSGNIVAKTDYFTNLHLLLEPSAR